MVCEGMVAVVRGLQEAGLAVSLLDGNRQYTLMPNHVGGLTENQLTRNMAVACQMANNHVGTESNNFRCDSGVQASDGRYTTVYRAAHCNVTPTSPTPLLAEFPPQKPTICRGHGNFEVGGTGSGDKDYTPVRASGTYRGGMCWPDRGSVCTPRPSHEPDAFANSLRKYPSMSPDRSTEIVERLISYTQGKNYSLRHQSRSIGSPTRTIDSNISSQNIDRYSSRNTVTRSLQKNIYEPEVTLRVRRTDESPTRDRSRTRRDDSGKSLYGRNFDVRHVKEGQRREKPRNPGFYPYTQPACPSIKEKYTGAITENTNNAVNMEIQVAVPMVSREVATVPGVEPTKRTVAVPLSPTTSASHRPEGGVFQNEDIPTVKLSPTFTDPKIHLNSPKSVQVTASLIDLINFDYKKRLFDRRSKSHEDIRISANQDVVQLFKSLKPNKKTDKIILKGLDKVLDKVGSIKKGDKVQIKVGSVKKYLNTNVNKQNLQKIHEPSTSQVRRKHGSNIFRAELNTTKGFVKRNDVDNIIKDWANSLNIKNKDFLSRNIDREEILNTLISRLKFIVYNRPKDDQIKAEIMEVVEDVPFDISGDNKRAYINMIVVTLLTTINNLSIDDCPDIKLALESDVVNSCDRTESNIKIKKDIQPTEEELKEFIVSELMDFLDKHDLKINFNIFDDVEMELVDILLDSIEAIRLGETIYVKEEIISLVHDVSWFSVSQSKCFADTLLTDFRHILTGSNVKETKSRSQTVLVMQNTCPSVSFNQSTNNTTDFSIGAISEADIESNLDYYMNQLTQQIDEWLTNLSLTCCTDKGFRQVVVNDLAADIVDRHKYVEKNPDNRGSCKDELEHLRYEIFKWINKLVGEDNTSTLEHAPELMQRIRSIPVPMLTMPDTPECCRPQGQPNQSPGKFNNSSFSPGLSKTKIGNTSQGSLKNKTPCQKCCGSKDESSKFGQGGNLNQSQNRPERTCSGTRVPGTCCPDDGQMPMFGPSGPGGSMMQQRPLPSSNRRKSSPGGFASGPMGGSSVCSGAGNVSQMPMRSQGGFGQASMDASGICSGAGNVSQMPMRSQGGFGQASMNTSGICSGASNVSQMPMRSHGGFGQASMNMRGICPGAGNVSQRSQSGFGSSSMAQSSTCSGGVNLSQMPMFGPTGPGGSMMEQGGFPYPNKRFSGPATCGGYASQPAMKSGTKQPGTCCTDENQMPSFGPTGPGGSMMEQRSVRPPSPRLSGPGRFASGPMAPCAYSSGMNASAIGGAQGGYGSPGAMSGGTHGGKCCNESAINQGNVPTGGRSAQESLPPCCQGKSQQQFEAELSMMNQSGGYMQNDQMNSGQSMFGPPGFGGSLPASCAPKPAKRRLTVPSEFAFGTGTCPANINRPQTYGQMDESMYGGTGFEAQAPPSSCCGGMKAGQISKFEPQGPGGSMMQPRRSVTSDRRYSSPGALPTGYMHEVCPREAQGQAYVPPPCCPGMQVTPTMPSVIQLNEEYDEFVKNWVKELPIPACTPEEVAFAEKARLGIYNGIWKSLTKLKFNPATFHNRFYYEDVFDDDIEELLGLLPPNPELETKKHLLKVNLIEKTTTTNEILKSIIAPSMYRQQLVDNVANNLPKHADVRGDDPVKLHEELQILNLAEDYILFARYKDEDKVKANIYKKKLLKKVEELVDEVKRTHGQELRDIDPGMYINDILSALHKVPVPGEDTVKEEADEILLGLEIEQWFSDLPLVENDNYQEQLNRRRLRDALAKKIHEMEKVVNLADCSADRELKHEVSKFLEKLPLQRDQDLNINFMVDELTNRMKNRPREGVPESGTGRKKSVAFEVPMDYNDFSRNMQFCSSFSELPEVSPAQFNQSSVSMHGPMDQYGGAFQNDCCKDSRQASKSQNGASSLNMQTSDQWHTLNDTQMPCQVCSQPRSSMSPHTQTYQSQSQIEQRSFAQQGNLAQQQCPSQMRQSSLRQQSGPNPMAQASMAQQQCPSQMGQSSLRQQSGQNSMGQASMAQHQCPSQMRQSSLRQQSGPNQMGQASMAQQQCPSQMGQSSFGQQQCPSQMAQSSFAQLRCPSQMEQSSLGQQSNHRQMSCGQQPGKTGQASFTQQQSQSQMGQAAFAQQPHSCGICQNSGQSNPQPQSYQMGPEMGQENMSQQLYQGRNGLQNQQQQHSQGCQHFSKGLKSTVSSQRMSHLESKPSTSSHNISKCCSPKDQSPKTIPSRHSRCFEDVPQPTLKTSGRLNQTPRPKQPSSDTSTSKRPKTPNKSQSQVASPSDQNFCGPSCPSAIAAKSSSSTTPSQDMNAPTSEYVQGFRAGQRQGRRNTESPCGQPVGYSTPRDGFEERRRSSDAGRSREDGGRIEMEDMEEEVETERDETRCRCMERMFRCRRKRPVCYPHEKFENECPLDTPVAVSKLIRSEKQKYDENRIGKPREEKRRFDSIDAAGSSTNLKRCIKCNKPRRSKSQEITTNIIDIKFQDDVLEWYKVHSNTVKVKMWGEKLQRIANKLQNSHEQEKLKIKIERYLKRVPSQFSECDDDRREFRKQLPDQLIRKLRKFYNKTNQLDPLNVYHVEMPNYYSKIQTNQDELRSVLRRWLKSIYFKRRDFLGRPIRRDDVIDFIEYKLQPFITDKSNSEQEYRYILKSKIIEAINELPVDTSGDCLNKQADKLIEDILKVTNINFENKKCLAKQDTGKRIRPTIKEIKEFITNQVTDFLEKTNMELRASKIFRLEMDLTDILVELLDNTVIHDNVNIKSRVCELMRNIGKVTMIHAVDFSDTLLRNFKDIYHAVTNNDPTIPTNPTSFLPSESYSVYVQNRSSKSKQRSIDLSIGDARHSDNALKGVNNYNKQLAHQINEWLKDIQIPKQKKASKDVAVKQLAADIVDRHKYLELNPSSRGTEAEELEHLKFQIFKWINNLVGEENKTTLERAPDLMKRIQNVPIPVLTKSQSSRAYVDHLTDVIFEWYHDLPIDLHSSEDGTMCTENVKILAENIEKAVKMKKSLNEAVNKEVNIWTKKVFRIQPKSSATEQLKVKLKAVVYKDESGIEKDPKQEKLFIRRYEDVIDDWIDTFPLEPKREASFASSRNEHIHELAVKLHSSRTKLNSVPPEVLNKKLQEEVSDWLKRIPLHQQTNKKSFRDQFAGRLIRNILECNLDESVDMREKNNSIEFTVTQIEGAIIDWLKTLPLYREKSITEKQRQEKIMLELANYLNSALHRRSERESDLEIEKHIKKLDAVFMDDQDFVQKTALQLKIHLQKLNMYGDNSQRGDTNEDEFLEANIEAWIRNLPLNVPSDVERKDLENKQKLFLKTIKELRAKRASDEVLIGEIVNFLKTLPLNRNDDFFLSGEADKLVKSLYVVPIGDAPRKSLPTSDEIVRDVISNWSLLLPLKPIHCPTELRDLIDQMTSEITDLIANPDHTVGKNNEEQIKQSILVYLRKFPIKPERQDEQQLNKMASALLNDLNDVQLFRNNYRIEANEPIYGHYVVDNQEFCIHGNAENIGVNLDVYLRRLTVEIDEWLNTLHGYIPEIHDKCFREIVVNDLASDIVDRHKYLEINPTIRGSDEDELEHLKYQIFKWVNKLVGEDNLVTIEHASELMTRIRNISAPNTATAPTDIRENRAMSETPSPSPSPGKTVRENDIDFGNLPPNFSPKDHAAGTEVTMYSVEAQASGPAMDNAQSMTSNMPSKPGEAREEISQTVGYNGPPMITESTSQTLAYVSEGVDATLTPRDIQAGPINIGSTTNDAGTMIYSQEAMTDNHREDLPPIQKNASQVFGPPCHGGSLIETPKETNQSQNSKPRRFSSPPQLVRSRNTSELENIPEGMTINEVHEHYDEIIKDLCAQLPFKVDNPEQERMADLARKGVHNTIWKTYFKFKSDPEIENDYVYMEFLLEETMDDCLDILSNPEIESMRQAWKGKIILHVMNMMKYVHSISDTPSFREQLGSKMDRLFTKDRFGEIEYQISQGFISRIADSYILYANYKNDDPVKANIYRHRLMRSLEVFVQEQTKQHNKEFRKLDNAKMCQKAFKILESVPLPTNDVLKDEADEVLLNEEIENWYHDLPVRPLESEYDEQFRRRMLEVLAKKIREMEKRPDYDESTMQREMKHEMSVFLKRRARLKQDEDLNINFMVEELTNRLKNRKNREIDYESFQKDVPLSSTFAQMEPEEAMAPLVHVQSAVQQSGHVCGQDCRRAGIKRSSLGCSHQAGQKHASMQSVDQRSCQSKATARQRHFSSSTDPDDQNSALLGMNQITGTTQRAVPSQDWCVSTHTPCGQTQPSMSEINQMSSEYIFNPNHMPQMTPYPIPMPPIDVSGYSTNSSPSVIAPNFQQPSQSSRCSLPRQIPSSNRFSSTEMPGLRTSTHSSARMSERMASRGFSEANVPVIEEERREEERIESRCRCVEYIRRRRRRVCFPYNDRARPRCYSNYPMPMHFPFSCFY